MTHPLSEKILLEAIDRIARSEDGRLQYLYLQRFLMSVPTSEEASALSAYHGERRFAAKLIGLMATGIAESGGRTRSSSDTSGGSDAEQPIVFAVPKPVDTRRATGAGRRITADTRVPGWDPPDDSSGKT